MRYWLAGHLIILNWFRGAGAVARPAVGVGEQVVSPEENQHQ